MQALALTVVDAAALRGQAMELLNVQGGHASAARGHMSTEVATSMFEAPRAPDITEPALLIRIPALWYPAMPTEELYRATALWWRVGTRRSGARYAFSVNRGVIREVYRIDGWRARQQGDDNWQDDKPGTPAGASTARSPKTWPPIATPASSTTSSPVRSARSPTSTAEPPVDQAGADDVLHDPRTGPPAQGEPGLRGVRCGRSAQCCSAGWHRRPRCPRPSARARPRRGRRR